MITSEGRALTEVQLLHAQPIAALSQGANCPPGATIVSVDLAGQSAKPASGADGTRIPLMRAGLSVDVPYTVSFVYVHAGTPFQKKGDIEMALPKMDVPIGVVEWEVFVPEQYQRARHRRQRDRRQALRHRRASVERDQLSRRQRGAGEAGAADDVLPDRFDGRVGDLRQRPAWRHGEIQIGRYSASTVTDAQRRVHLFRRAEGEVVMTAELRDSTTRADDVRVRRQSAARRARHGGRVASGNRHGHGRRLTVGWIAAQGGRS